MQQLTSAEGVHSCKRLSLHSGQP